MERYGQVGAVLKALIIYFVCVSRVRESLERFLPTASSFREAIVLPKQVEAPTQVTRVMGPARGTAQPLYQLARGTQVRPPLVLVTTTVTLSIFNFRLRAGLAGLFSS